MKASMLCWNVAGRVTRLEEQAERIVDCAPDVVCLQEVSRTTGSRWIEQLKAARWHHIAVAPSEPALAADRPRLLCVLTASRRPLSTLDVHDVPWPERVLATRLDGLELVNLHSPISPSPGLAKVLTHETVYAHLLAGSGPRVVCGDLNTPRREHPDGRVWTFARSRHGKLRPERGPRWDRAELALIKGLEPSGFRDAFRDLHGLEVREVSWAWQTWGGGYRLDHLIVSSEVEVSEVSYLHEWRTDGLSDHSPLSATLSWPS